MLKTKPMVIEGRDRSPDIKIVVSKIEHVHKYKYLGVHVNTKGALRNKINETIGKTGNLYNAIKTKFLGKKGIIKGVKGERMTRIVKPLLTYICASWHPTKRNKGGLDITEM